MTSKRLSLVAAGQLADNQSAACRDAFTHGYAEAVRCVASTPNMDETQRTLVLRHMQNNVAKRFGAVAMNGVLWSVVRSAQDNIVQTTNTRRRVKCRRRSR